MIAHIIQSYFSILLSVGLSSLALFVIGLYFITRNTFGHHKSPASAVPPPVEVSAKKPFIEQTDMPEDLSAIAGEDVFTTQLDLARAFVETNKIQMAKTILKTVVQQGNVAQQEEAQHLLSQI